MAENKDYYKILGVGKKATAEEIKKKYRKLAREYHPDRNPDKPGAEDRFKEIQEAYDALSDPEKRKQYDAMRDNPFGGFGGSFNTPNGGRFYRAPDGTYIRVDSSGQPGGAGGFGDVFGGEGGGGAGGFGDFFSRIFGGAEPGPAPSGSARRSPSRGQRIDTTLRLSFEQALQGGKTEVTIPRGETIRINIPKGVRPGFRIRLKGHGGPAPMPGGHRGDLYVTFEVDPHPRFRRENDDLYTPVKVSAFEAMLGASRSIENPYGKRIKVSIPSGTQPGEKFRLKGQGIETDKAVGDLYVEVEVTIPRKLSEEQQKVIREAARKAGLE